MEENKTDNLQLLGRIITEGYYDFQQVRISSVNRIRDIVRKTIEGIGFSEVEKKKEEKDFTKKYTDNVLFKKLDEIYEKNKITDREYKYMIRCREIMKDSRNLERNYKKAMEDFISGVDIYIEFLSRIRGIGEVLSANLIKEFGDCSQYDTVSKLWAHCGQNVKDGKAPKRVKGELITYSPRLKTLVWKISDSLMKQNKSYYRQIYDTEKEKQMNRIYEEGYLFEKYGKPYKKEDTKLSKGHGHNRALRKMRKIFLSHYWECRRELAGLNYKKTYVEGVLLHNHIVNWRDVIEMERLAGTKQPSAK